MNRSLVVAVLACSLMLVTHIAHAAEQTSFRELEKRWESARKQLGLPGVSIAIVKDGQIIYEKGLGLANVEHAKPFTPNTSSYIASVTKVFLAFAIMQLSDEGKVNIDAPVRTYLPNFKLADAALTERITVRDLLCHRYGLSNWPITFAEAYSGVFDDAFYYREMETSKINGKWSYSNLHFTLLGRIVEAVSGQPWQTYLQDHVFRPAGMSGSTARASELYSFTDCATPYVEENNAWFPSPLRKVDSTMHAAGGIGSSAHDLARWILIHLNRGAIDNTRLLSESAIKEILTTNVTPNSRYEFFGRKEMGLAWYLGDYKGDLLVHHFGGYAGAHAHVSFMPEHGIGVAVIANSNEDMSTLVHYMAADAYDALLGRKPGKELREFIKKTMREQKDHPDSKNLSAPESKAVSPILVSSITGEYHSDTWGPLEVRTENGELIGRIGNFRMRFSQNEKGELLVESPIGNGKAALKTDNNVVPSLQINMRRDWIMEYTR